MKKKAYCPYSKFRVGAALLCEDGTVITGNTTYCPYSKFRVGAALLCEDGTVITGNITYSSYSNFRVGTALLCETAQLSQVIGPTVRTVNSLGAALLCEDGTIINGNMTYCSYSKFRSDDALLCEDGTGLG